jgi:hypothetical protein
VGHEDQFPPPSLNDRCRLGERTFAGMGGKEEHAPETVVRLISRAWLKTTQLGRLLSAISGDCFAPIPAIRERTIATPSRLAARRKQPSEGARLEPARLSQAFAHAEPV